MVNTIKFSQMPAGGDIANNDTVPGLLSGANVLFNNPWTFLASGSTADRPVPSTAIDGRLRFNTDTLTYEYYDTLSSTWVELSGSGTGTVNPGATNDLAYYASSGTTVSPLLTAANSVLVTSPSSVPSLSTTLPSGLSIPGATITASTAALAAGSVVAAPVSGTDLVNKTYADGLYTSSVHSITGTTNQIIASSPTGDVTLSLPQDIATGSTPTFLGLTTQTINSLGVINDTSLKTLLTFSPVASAVNYFAISNAATSGSPQLQANGTDTNVGITLATKGTSPLVLFAAAGATVPLFIASGTGYQHNTLFSISDTAATRVVTFQDSSGTVAWLTDIPSVSPAALTASPDTNVTITLGGTPSTALLQATSITLGWTGQLSLTRGGSNASLTASNGGIVYSTASAMAILSGTATATQMLQSGASGAPAWSTTTWPATSTINQLLYSSSANTVAGLATANNGTLITSAGGVPSISSTLPTAVQSNITQLGSQSQALNMNSHLINNVTDPVSAQDAATMHYVQSLTGGGHLAKNMIIGGDFGTNPWQRGTSFTAVATAQYTADRWVTGYVSTAVANITQSSDAPTVAQAGILTTASLLHTITTAQASIGSTDYYSIIQKVEGYNWSRLAQTAITLSFWVKATVTGTYCVSLNNGADRSYVAQYTVNSTNTWEFKTINILASPSAGTWNYTNSTGLYVQFALSCGSTFQTTAGAWQTGLFYGTSSQVNALATIANTFQLDLVQLESGSSATSFEIRTFCEELILCQRYYTKSFLLATAPAQNVASLSGTQAYRATITGISGAGSFYAFPVWMRGTPSITYYNPFGANTNWYNGSTSTDSGASSSVATSPRNVFIGNAQLATDNIGNSIYVHLQANAEL